MNVTVYTMTVFGSQEPYTHIWMNDQKACREALCAILRPFNSKAAARLVGRPMRTQAWRHEWEDAWAAVITNVKVEFACEVFDLPDPIVVVTVEGGLVQDVMATKNCQVLVVDFDVEGTTDEVVQMEDGHDAVLNRYEVKGSTKAQRFLENLPPDAN